MNYVSTRNTSQRVASAEAIRQGIAPDGGLYTAESIPVFSKTDLAGLTALSYQELAVKVLERFLTDYEPADLCRMVNAAYSYPDKFADPSITPVVKLTEGEYILNLWHGPTSAFKDVALQLLPHLMTKASELAKDPNEIVILVATSGDTGKAALEGFRDVPGTRIIVFFPEDGVSQIQKLQMITQEGKNTSVIGVTGNFDDAQNGVKQIFTDPAIAKRLLEHKLSFSSANSINWGRLVPQIVYYFFGYFELCRSKAITLGDQINVAVPTGNFGNILAAYLAKRMGLPLAKLICASNSNNVLADFINTGVYDRNRPFYTTISPSMDILISSNLERLLFYLSGQDSAAVTGWMKSLKETGRYQIHPEMEPLIKELFYGGFATEAETQAAIRQVFQEQKMVIDTHTAVGKVVYDQYHQASKDSRPVLIASTASPFKFNSSVLQAIAGEADIKGKSEFELLEKLQSLSGMTIPAGLKKLDQKTVLHRTVCQKEEMARIVTNILKV